jgi:hypothetical protein
MTNCVHVANGLTLFLRIRISATLGRNTSGLLEKIMADIDPGRTFRGLPLTPEQDAEVRHYIKVRKQQGKKWDTPELKAMLRDMLQPPDEDEEGFDYDNTRSLTERAEFCVDETMDPIEAAEERNAAFESEIMKRF